MSSGISAHNLTLEAIFDPFVAGTTPAVNTGIDGGGAELSTQFASLVYGTAAAATGIHAPLGDLNTYYAAKGTANYALPINGNTYAAQSQSATVSTSAQYEFSSGSSGWALSGTSSSGGAVTPGTSGALPAGAATVQFSLTLTTSTGAGSTTNTASSPTAVGTSVLASVAATSAPLSGDNDRWATLVITYRNSGGSAISTTTIFLKATAVGSS